jgi:hypothetical protein
LGYIVNIRRKPRRTISSLPNYIFIRRQAQQEEDVEEGATSATYGSFRTEFEKNQKIKFENYTKPVGKGH